jgi:Ulp1 family protease
MTKKYKEIWGRCTSDEAEIIREQLARSPLRDLSNNVHQTRANYVPRFKAEDSSISGRISEDVQKFEVLVYPRDDSDAVTVTRSDFEMLKPMGFLSDSVIDFYIK